MAIDEVGVIRSGIALRRAGRLNEATAAFQSVLSTNPRNEWARIEVANDLRDCGSLSHAKALLLAGIALGGRSPHLQMALADILQREGDWSGAEGAITSAIVQAPQSSKGHVEMIRLRTAMGRYEEAVAVAGQALATVRERVQRTAILADAATSLGLKHADRVDVNAPTAQKGRPLDDAIIVSMVKDEGDIILPQLRHHYGLGFRFFAIANNGSSDETESRIKQFRAERPDATLLYVEDPVIAHHQDIKTTALARYAVEFLAARNATIEWVFPLDADEFLSLPVRGPDLCELLGRVQAAGYRVISSFLCNMATEGPREELDDVEDLRAAFVLRSHFRARPVMKVAYRHGPETFIEMGNHFVMGAADCVEEVWPAAEAGVYLAHHPYRSLKQVRSKVLNGGRSLENAPSIVGGSHWRTYYERYKVEGEAVIAKILMNYIAGVRKAVEASR
jgi:tetratricopeptide (TPR) repeat protein